jgi:protein-S-isoprenylcysteine O-methyltransferase Ste14
VSFRKAKTSVNPTKTNLTSTLVTDGIYKNTRNPMYVGFLFFLIGWGFILYNIYSMTLCIGFVLYMNRFQIQPEEKALMSIFGEEFVDYKRRVRRWL